MLLIGDSPIETYRLLSAARFSWPDGIGYTLFFATPLIFTGLAVAVAFRCGLLNIGAEGQLYVGGVCDRLGRDQARRGLPAVLLVPLCCAAQRSRAGAVWGAIPGVLKARFGSHEVINTIMMNFIAVALVSYFTQYHYRMPGDPIMETRADRRRARTLRGLGGSFRVCPSASRSNVAFLLALVACWLVYVFLWRTKWGYEIRATGQNPAAAEYGGISIRKQIVLAMAISGGLAGMVGINEVLGYRTGTTTASPTTTGSPASRWRCWAATIRSASSLAALLFAVLLRGGMSGRCVHAARLQGHRADSAGDRHPVRRRRSDVPRADQEVRVPEGSGSGQPAAGSKI